jgi:hypothetical protein
MGFFDGRRIPLALLFLAWTTPGCDLPGEGACTAEARPSVVVNLQDEDKNPIGSAEVTFALRGEAHESCETVSEGTWHCGVEVEGLLEVRVVSQDFLGAENILEVQSDGCHVQTKTLDLTLEWGRKHFAEERVYTHDRYAFFPEENCQLAEDRGEVCQLSLRLCPSGDAFYQLPDEVKIGTYSMLWKELKVNSGGVYGSAWVFDYDVETDTLVFDPRDSDHDDVYVRDDSFAAPGACGG